MGMYDAVGPGILLVAALPLFALVSIVLLRDRIKRARSSK
jgi:hypothetical protein